MFVATDDVALTVRATDADEGSNGEVFYTTLEGPNFPGTNNPLFAIDNVSGQFTLIDVTRKIQVT